MRNNRYFTKSKRRYFFYLPQPPFPPGQDCFKQFPTPGPEGLDLSQGYPGGMVTSKIEPSIKQGSILINTYCPLSPNLDKEKIEFHVLFVESPVFFFMSLPIFLYHWLAGLLLQCQPIFLLFVAISSVWQFIQRFFGSARTDKPFIPCTVAALVFGRKNGACFLLTPCVKNSLCCACFQTLTD